MTLTGQELFITLYQLYFPLREQMQKSCSKAKLALFSQYAGSVFLSLYGYGHKKMHEMAPLLSGSMAKMLEDICDHRGYVVIKQNFCEEFL